MFGVRTLEGAASGVLLVKIVYQPGVLNEERDGFTTDGSGTVQHKQSIPSN
jgi:hypothetical protein